MVMKLKQAKPDIIMAAQIYQRLDPLSPANKGIAAQNHRDWNNGWPGQPRLCSAFGKKPMGSWRAGFPSEISVGRLTAQQKQDAMEFVNSDTRSPHRRVSQPNLFLLDFAGPWIL